MVQQNSLLLVVLFALFSVCQAAYYLPGISPNKFSPQEVISLKANKVTSTKNPLQYDYYDLPFCKRKQSKSKVGVADNLGERLAGDLLTVSPYDISVLLDSGCKVLCRKVNRKNDVHMLNEVIDQEYRVHWVLDNLPVGVRTSDEVGGSVYRGFPVGVTDLTDPSHPKRYIYNHVRIIVRYSERPEEHSGVRIVGFEVVPFSIKHSYEGTYDKDTKLSTCNPLAQVKHNPSNLQEVGGNGNEVIYTYEVRWEKSELAWTNRWDVYIRGAADDDIHYFSIVNSLMIVLFLSGVLAMIMLRTLHRDISAYNEIQTLEEAQEESGWKLVHGDVFRAPDFSPMLLSVLAGTGLQILLMTVVTMVCALFGLMSPAQRGSLLTTVMLLYVFMGSVSGYASARVYKLCGGKDWKQNTLLTAALYPSIIGTMFVVCNIVVASEGSSMGMSLNTMLLVLLLWLGVSSPLVLVGAYFGFKADTIEVPVRTNQIKRHIPDPVWYTNPVVSVALGGILPFGAVCIELFFIMSALWLHQLYYVFGFLFIVLIILVITCSEITIVMCYFQLCNEDYRWWWRSFLSAGSAGGYLFLYSVWYYASKLSITGAVPTLLYFMYMGMAAITFGLLTGAIGFFSCFWFVRKIYGAIKVD